MKKSRVSESLSPLCDGVELLNTQQSAAALGVTEDAIRQATVRGALCPAKRGHLNVYTRRDLQRWHGRAVELEITRELTNGAHPLEIYLNSEGRYRLEDVTRVMHSWARLSGVWLIEGPRGSFARWLARMGLVRFTPRELRRIVESLIRDNELARRLALTLDAQRSTTDAQRSTDGEKSSAVR